MELEKRGLPTATICSDLFEPLARSLSKTNGLSTLPLVIIPHPLGGIGPEEVKAKADKAFDRVVQMLTESRERLAVGQEVTPK